jgi:predicted nucleic acid-binding protein
VIAYVDSSVLLRFALAQKDALAEWPVIQRAVASALVEVECLRSIDRLRLTRRLADSETAVRRHAVLQALETFEIMEPNRSVLARAAQPLPTSLGTLDAIHLATAALWREERDEDLVMATHDLSLATAARAIGMDVVGI